MNRTPRRTGSQTDARKYKCGNRVGKKKGLAGGETTGHGSPKEKESQSSPGGKGWGEGTNVNSFLREKRGKVGRKLRTDRFQETAESNSRVEEG